MILLKRYLKPENHSLNPLSPNSDKNEISLNIITTCSNNQVMRIKIVITKDKTF